MTNDNVTKILAPRSGWDISREPGSQAPTKSSDSHEIFAAIHAVLARIWVQGISIFIVTHNMQEIFFLVTGRNILSLQLINCHRKKIIVTERNLLPKADISCHKTKFFVAGTNVLFEAEITCQRKIFLGIRGHFLSQTVTYGHRKEFHATGRNFMPQLVISWKKFLVRARSVLSQEEITLH